MAELYCSVIMEHLKLNGEVERKSQLKNPVLKLCRNELRDVVLLLQSASKEFKYPLKDVKIYKKFANEGKSTIKVEKFRVQFLLSNCPPDNLKQFLQTLSTKLERTQVENVKLSEKERLLSVKSRVLEEISPLSLKDVHTVHRARLEAIENTTKPTSNRSLKRKFEATGKENSSQVITLSKDAVL